MIERERLQELRDKYHDAWFEHMGAANANHGAMQAIEELIREFDSAERAERELAVEEAAVGPPAASGEDEWPEL